LCVHVSVDQRFNPGLKTLRIFDGQRVGRVARANRRFGPRLR
jgi:hypothetical protein